MFFTEGSRTLFPAMGAVDFVMTVMKLHIEDSDLIQNALWYVKVKSACAAVRGNSSILAGR